VFAFLEGEVAETVADAVVLDVGGVGYRLFVSKSTLSHLPSTGGTVRLRARMVVREDEVSLFGFLEEREEEVFSLLTQVSGVGPRLALTVLSSLNPETFQAAVFSGDSDRLRLVPGIGKKLAERIVLELKDRVEEPVLAMGRPDRQALEALLNLGVHEAEARRALEGLKGRPEEIVREALRRLGDAV